MRTSDTTKCHGPHDDEETALSTCTHGCKVVTCRACGDTAVQHMRMYGCTHHTAI